MSRRESIKNTYGDILSEPEIRAQLSIEEIVRRQIERINISATYDQRIFSAHLGALKALLPKHKRVEVEEKASEYIFIVQYYKYKYNCGVPIGTPENPIMGSPVLAEDLEVDWDKLYELMMDALEESGITWRIENETIEVGQIEKEKDEEPTPWFGNKNAEKTTKKIDNND